MQMSLWNINSEVANLKCEEKLLELGADSFWDWDVGAFVFAGDETTISVSRRGISKSLEM